MSLMLVIHTLRDHIILMEVHKQILGLFITHFFRFHYNYLKENEIAFFTMNLTNLDFM